MLADFLASKEYERHLASLRTHFSLHVGRVSAAVRDCFPEGPRLTTPRGGFVLWVELPRGTDAVELSRHHLRLSCGNRGSPSLGRALQRLGGLARQPAGAGRE